MPEEKTIYFISDLHLGFPDEESSRQREKKIVQWLTQIQANCDELFLVGDVFDFWHEWKYVVPKGYNRFLGKLAEFTDAGITVHFFTGNHDIWAYDYLSSEIGLKIHKTALKMERQSRQIYIAHGDGLGPGDWNYKLLKKIFTSSMLQWLFARLHPNFAMSFGLSWSRSSRNREKYLPFLEENEWLIQHSRAVLLSEHFDYFIYGHRHVPSFYTLNEKSVYINLGQWINQFHFGLMQNGKITLEKAEI
jgi:UDP-2,3-diacylglucosamine hydrolase